MPELIKFKCPHCGELMEADKDAVGQNAHCASCGGEIVIPQEPIVRKAADSSIQHITSSASPTILGVAGAGLMGLGTFLPFMKVPIVGSINYFHNAQGDGTIIVLLAIGSAVCFLAQGYLVPLLASLITGGILGYDLWNVLNRLQESKEQMSRELAGNPFRGLAEGLFHTVQIEVGPYVIATGAILVFAAAIWGEGVKAKTQPYN